MEYIIILSKQYLNLSKFEFLSLFYRFKHIKQLKENIFLLKTKISPKRIINIATKSSHIRYIYKKLTALSLLKIEQPYKLNFYDIDKNKQRNPTKKAKEIWDFFILHNRRPKVNLKNPRTNLFLLTLNKEEFLTQKIFENKNPELKRKPHLRPKNHPTSLDPRIAKATINIISRGKQTKIVDPMCGSGGILIEAGLLNHKIYGFDISKKMLNLAKDNLKFYGIKNFILQQKNALNLTNNFYKNIIVDLPYGKNSFISEELDELYKKFLSKPLKNSIIMFPKSKESLVIKTLKEQKKKFKKIEEIYIHKNLTKVIILLY